MTTLTTFQTQKAAEFEKKLAYKFDHKQGCSFFSDTAKGPMCTCGVMKDALNFLTTAIAEAYQKGIDALAERIMCPDCEGSGVYDSPSAYDPCGSCDGTGYYFDGSLLDAYKEIDTTNTRITAMSPEGLSDKRSKEGELEVEEKDL